MGEVYRAEDLTLGQPVALKFLPEALIHNEDALRRFHNEVRLARQVSHPNVCRVHDVGEAEGQVFLSMEYVDGEDLASLLRRIGHLPEAKALEIARKLCAGLAAAHEKGVLHRDLKPANVMLDSRGQVLLTDFGLAGLSEQIAGAEVRSGTPAYMAPEQLAGKEVTVRSDIYSLGLVLYEIFTGKRPYEGQSIADLVRARAEAAPESLSTHVRDVDPAVERIILRCLQPEPSRRPPSAIAVSAALPGGDPLAAALAAGETPSPQMVAAAGEGAGLSIRFALPLFLAILAGLAAYGVFVYKSSAVETIGPRYSPDVLTHKIREIIQRAGYTTDAGDTEGSFAFEDEYLATDKPKGGWRAMLQGRPSPLRFWYRQSPDPMAAGEFHDDLLTPGMVTRSDPPAIGSGMISVAVDHRGRLLDFRAMPSEKQEKVVPNPPPADWTPLFEAAELDVSKLTPDQPQRAWLETADTRMAWTGTWPGTSVPLRVEAASWQGKPTVFVLQGPWTGTERTGASGLNARLVILMLVSTTVLIGAPLLARHNFLKGRGDRRGAFRIAIFMFTVHMVLWGTRVHIVPAVSLLGMFVVAVCTATFYAVLVWTVYLAIEPFIRRHWPQTMISVTRVLSGRIRDPIVGRDILIGVAIGLSWRGISYVLGVFQSDDPRPDFLSPEVLTSFRAALGESLESVPHAIRESLIFGFMLVVLRVLFRNQWLAAAAFVGIWGLISITNGSAPAAIAAAMLVYAIIAVAVLRFGLLAIATAMMFDSIINEIPITLNVSVWYFGLSVVMCAAVLAFVSFGFREAIRGQRLLREDVLS